MHIWKKIYQPMQHFLDSWWCSSKSSAEIACPIPNTSVGRIGSALIPSQPSLSPRSPLSIRLCTSSVTLKKASSILHKTLADVSINIILFASANRSPSSVETFLIDSLSILWPINMKTTSLSSTQFFASVYQSLTLRNDSLLVIS